MGLEWKNAETAEPFREYRESHRGVFIDEILRFIRAANCTQAELETIHRAVVVRAQELRAPTGRKRGRPRGGIRLAEAERSGAAGSELNRFLASGSHDDAEFWKVQERDEKEHGRFRDVCVVMGDQPVQRPLLLEQIRLFAQGGDCEELAAIRKAVTASRETVKRERAGRPNVLADEEIMYRARRAAWMRYVEGRTQTEISRTLDLPTKTQPGDGRYSTLRDLERYLAAAIWRAVPPSYIRESAAGREIAPGALDNKLLQHYIRLKTGLPFHTHTEECKLIVTALWPRGSKADWQVFERAFRYRQKKRGA
jgi:hypothetical protein